MDQLIARGHRSKLRSFIFYFIVIVITNVVLLSSLPSLLRPTKEMWLPKFRRKATLKHGTYVQKFPITRTNLNRTLQILLWTPLFGDPSWAFDLKSGMASCPVSDCVLSSDKSTIAHSHAVVFHAMDLLNYFIGYPMPEYRRTDQVWVLYNIEPPPNIAKDFRSYGGVFNWTLMYRADSDIHLPYFQIEKLPQKLTKVKDIAATKTAGVFWVASNCGDQARRQMLVRELQKHIQVDTYGKCGDYELNNMADTKHYKFYMALENSYCRDYITEKFTGPLRHEQIPIVAGGGDYSKVAPPHSFIDISDFNTIQELAEYLKYLDKNDTAYNSYFDWHREYHMVRTYQMKNLFCDLCEAVHDETRPHQTYTDIQGYIQDDTCQQWTKSDVGNTVRIMWIALRNEGDMSMSSDGTRGTLPEWYRDTPLDSALSEDRPSADSVTITIGFVRKSSSSDSSDQIPGQK